MTKPRKWGNREVNTIWTVKAKHKEGNGKELVEQRSNRTIDQMYARMLASGELQGAMMRKSRNNFTRGQAEALIDSAMVAPNYMSDAEAFALANKMQIIDADLRKDRKKKEDEIVFQAEAKKRGLSKKEKPAEPEAAGGGD